VSGTAKAAGGGVVAAGGTGIWVSLDGWPAAAVAGAAVVAGLGLSLWVLASDARTERVLGIIAALRFQRR
jgi:hypothetical protein